MFCLKCGCKISDEARFCSSCGSVIVADNSDNFDKVKTMLLRCGTCNGELTINDNQPIMLCPYCGSKELIVESDEVKIAKIKSNAYRDVELGKQQTEMELKKMDIQEKEKMALQTKKNKLIGFAMIFGSIGLFILCVEFQWLFGGGARLFIMLLCVGLFIAGCKILKSKKEN